MISFWTKKAIVKIVYLFMNADGACTKEEKKKFDSICNSLEIGSDFKKEIIQVCNEHVVIRDREDNSDKVIGEIKKLLGDVEQDTYSFFNENCGFGGMMLNSEEGKEAQAFTIWSLINLGYADEEYSEPEKRVVNYLVKKWDFDKIIFDSMIDTAETILMLVNQKEWVKSTDKSYEDKNEMIKVINKNIKKLYKDMKITISEADV